MTIKLINIKAIKPLSCTFSNCMPRMISSVPCATAQSVAITIFTVYTFIAYVSIDINDKLFMTNLAKYINLIFVNMGKYTKIQIVQTVIQEMTFTLILWKFHNTFTRLEV